ncbi:MAG: 30S ribosomal protein S8 [Candidatus Micrarchaeota archaeon]|nr:MAG: 30S ribosomal protein S8 [Candidatus Micrarchaeota archaeon]
MENIIVNNLNKIKIYEFMGYRECKLYYSKLMGLILELLKKHNYIEDYKEISEGNIKYFIVRLNGKINNIGGIMPRFAVKKDDIYKYEQRFIPARNFGFVIISTSKGLMTSKEAIANNVGGRLIAYVY